MIGGSSAGRGLEFFLLTPMSRLALWPIWPPIQWAPEVLSLGVKQVECEADHSPPPSAKVKNVWSYTSTPPTCLHSMVLSYKKKKPRDYFTFYTFIWTAPISNHLSYSFILYLSSISSSQIYTFVPSLKNNEKESVINLLQRMFEK
jgi:hypothetical protein